MEGQNELQEQRSEFIKRLRKKYTSDYYYYDDPTSKSEQLTTLESNLSELEKQKERFESTHEKILGSEPKDSYHYTFFDRSVYFGVINNYINARSALLDCIKEKDGSSKSD